MWEILCIKKKSNPQFPIRVSQCLSTVIVVIGPCHLRRGRSSARHGFRNTQSRLSKSSGGGDGSRTFNGGGDRSRLFNGAGSTIGAGPEIGRRAELKNSTSMCRRSSGHKASKDGMDRGAGGGSTNLPYLFADVQSLFDVKSAKSIPI
jgi:hypothetical protein